MLRTVLSLLAPPLCAACGGAARPSEALCGACAAAIARAGPRALFVPGADWALAAADYSGAARGMVGALKFKGRLPVAAEMAAAIAAAAGDRLDGATVVPVPPAPRRRRRRGFDPADAIARAIASTTGLALSRCLSRRNGPRQVGRPRRDRLASPPLVSATLGAPERALLIDDVATTGATLSACVTVLRAHGAREVGAATFARAK